MCLRTLPARWQISWRLIYTGATMHLQAQPQTLELSRWPTGHTYPSACPKGQTAICHTRTWEKIPGMTEHKETWGRMTTEPECLGVHYTLGATWTHKPALRVLGVCPTSPKPMAWYSGAPRGRSSISQPQHTTGGSKALAAVKTKGKEHFLCEFED